MPGLEMDTLNVHSRIIESSGSRTPNKDSFTHQGSPKSPLSPQSLQSDSIDLFIDGRVDTSLEQLYHNVCEIQSSDQSPSRASYLSYGEESRIDSELCHLVGYVKNPVKKELDHGSRLTSEKEIGFNERTSMNKTKIPSPSPKKNLTQMNPQIVKKTERISKKPSAVSPMKKQRNFGFRDGKAQKGGNDDLVAGVKNPDVGLVLLKQARKMVSTGENPQKALDSALRALKFLEKCSNDKPSLELVMCLHVLAAIYCTLGQYQDAIPALERAIGVPKIEDGQNYALAKFAGCMQLGDTYAAMGQIENSILFYTAGLEIQRQVLGESDPRLAETCRYVAEAYVQAMQFDEAEKLCQMALDIDGQKCSSDSLKEVANRRLMGLICESKGDYETALEHYVLASMVMASNGRDIDVASIDCNIGDAYLSLARYDEAVFVYQKSLSVYKTAKGENHPAVASVFVRLANLYNKIGKFKESKSYCENALRMYEKLNPAIPLEETASGLIDVAAIYQSVNEMDQALNLLKKALKLFGDSPGQQSTIAGIEAQMGVIYYMMGDYSISCDTFKSAVSKFRASGEKKCALFGIALNQMGLACVQCYAINEAADLFEEARSILETEYGPYHPDTLGVYSNLAGTYDAMGRLDDAIEILEYVVGMREERLGTANPGVEDEKRRLAELLKEAGRNRNRKSRSLVTLLDSDSTIITDNTIQVL